MSDEKWTCTRCKKEIEDEEKAVWIGSKKSQYDYSKICTDCELIIWDSPIKIVFHWGIPDWVEPAIRNKRILQNFNQWFRHSQPCVIHYISRDEADTVAWQYNWVANGQVYDVSRGPFSYRGYCYYGHIVVLVDNVGIETPESLEWITYHELGHHECQKIAKMANAAWDAENKNQKRDKYEWEDDVGHEADSEEQHVNRMATAFMGGKEYARPWWRKRVDAYKAGLPSTEFPDCYAPVPEIKKVEGLVAYYPSHGTSIPNPDLFISESIVNDTK